MSLSDLPDVHVMAASGASIRQVDYWTRTGRLCVAHGGGSGIPRRWQAGEDQVCRDVTALVAAGIQVDVACWIARQGAGINQLGPRVSVILRPVL